MAERSAFLDLVDERVVVYDGAFGTYMQEQGLTADDFGGPDLEGCNEILVLTRPDVVAGMHEAFFAVGVDVVETATFGGVRRARSTSTASPTRPMRSTSTRPGSPGRWRRAIGGFVAGSIGPGTKFASLGQIRFADLRDAYEVQAHGLLEGGVDLLLIETQFDLLGLKAAMIGSRRAMAAVGREVPDAGPGHDGARPAACCPAPRSAPRSPRVDALHPDVFGLNCATGPSEMSEHLRHLSQHARMPISCLPERRPAVGGRRQDALRPHARAARRLPDPVRHRARRAGRRRLLRHDARAPTPARRRACRDLTPARREPVHEPSATSIYSAVPFEQDTSFLMIGERTNANGSKKFRDALLEGDWDTCTKMASEQTEGGRAHPRRLRRLRRPRRHRSTWTRSPAASPPRPTRRW